MTKMLEGFLGIESIECLWQASLSNKVLSILKMGNFHRLHNCNFPC